MTPAPSRDPSRLTELERALAGHGVSLAALAREARSVVLFGSQAAGCAGPTSDWDVLCIGTGVSRRRGGLDLVWVDPRIVDSAAWLGADLSGHVAAHGIWIEGSPSWDLATVDFSRAAHRKQEHLARRLRSLERAWALLGRGYQDKHSTLVRRDVQRWSLLERGLPIPPSASLDAVWNAEARQTWLLDALHGLGAAPSIAAAISLVA